MAHLYYNDLWGAIKALKKRCCCGDIGITTLSPPVTAPTTNGAKILVNLTTGVGYYWDGDSWEIAFTALPNAAQIKTIEVDVTSDQIKSMFTTPLLIIPGEVGKIVSLLKAVGSFTYGGTQYTGGGTVNIDEETSGNNISNGIFSAAQVNGTANVISAVTAPGLTNTLQTSGKGATLVNASAPFATGNGSIKLSITYQMITI